MGEAMGGLYDSGHGVCMAICLPYIIEHNLIADPAKFAKVAEVLGECVEGLPVLKAARKAVDAAWKLCADLNIPTAREEGLREEDFDRLAEAASNNVCVGDNPRVMTKEDFHLLFKKMYDR